MYISYYLQNKSFSGISKAQIRSALEESFSEFLFSNGNSKKDHLFWGYFCLSGFEKSRSNLSSRFMTFVKVGIWFLINEDVLTLSFKLCHKQIWNIFFCWYHCKHIFGQKKLGISNWPIEGKNYILHYCVHSEKNGRQIKRVE